MILMQTAFTDEIDSPEIAVREILAQLQLEKLRKNTIAIVTAYWECWETGVLGALSNALPFDIIGCTTLGSSVGFGYGLEQVSVAVMTSDDVEFITALSAPVSVDDEEAAARSCYRELRSKLDSEPKTLFAFCPPGRGYPSSRYAKALDSESGGIPIFGTTANDNAVAFTNARVFYNSGAYGDRLALLAVCGNVSASFFGLKLEDEATHRICCTITKTDGYRLLEINDMPAAEYFKGLGILTVDSASLAALPTLIDYKDGTPPSRIPLFVTDEGVTSVQQVPAKSELAVSSFGYNDILRTAESVIEQVQKSLSHNSTAPVFIASSLSRCLMITPNNENELRLVSDILGERQPYIMIYTAGGICPETGSGEKPVYTDISFSVMALE